MRWIGVAIAAVLATVWIRVAVSSSDELAQARAAEAAGDTAEALRHYQYALRWYSPLASAPGEAADALWRIGKAAAKKGDRATALAALRRLRGGIRATRWVLSPFGDRAEAVDAQLAELTADAQLAQNNPATIRGRDRATLVADHRRLLALDPMPTPFWSLLVGWSFLGWVGGALMTIARGLTREAKVVKGPLLRWGAWTLACLALWVFGLANA